MCGGEKSVWLISLSYQFYCEPRTALKKTHHKCNREYWLYARQLPSLKNPSFRIHHPLNQYATHFLSSFLFRLIHYGKPTSNPKTKGSFLQIKAHCRIDLMKGIAQDDTANSCHYGFVLSKTFLKVMQPSLRNMITLKMLSLRVYIPIKFPF